MGIAQHAEELFKGHTMQKEAYLDGYDYAIDKACEWMRNNLGYYDRHEVHIGKSYEEVVIDDFRKALEE